MRLLRATKIDTVIQGPTNVDFDSRTRAKNEIHKSALKTREKRTNQENGVRINSKFQYIIIHSILSFVIDEMATFFFYPFS